jgi:nicotinate-nucleotide adenylyltransferase
MRLGIFGGSFDPPHVGHLLTAQDAYAALSLDRMLVVPAGQQPLKRGTRTPASDRLAMTRLGFGDLTGFDVDPIEIDRGGLSYMVDTVELLRQRWPAAELHVLVGEDAAATFSQWKEPARLRSMAQVVVLRREIASAPAGSSPALASALALPWHQLATRRVDVSSTEIRARVRDGRSIRGFVTDAVAEYIVSTDLYLRDPIDADVSARA